MTSLLFGSSIRRPNLIGNYSFAWLFSGNTKLIDASELKLPSTVLTGNCYRNMFSGCTSLIGAPELPAKSLTDNCYMGMFIGCKSLVTAPELPATTLVTGCYKSMYYGCKSLASVKAAFTTISDASAIDSWLYGVASSGTFYKNAEATWDVTGANGVPSGWTVETYTP